MGELSFRLVFAVGIIFLWIAFGYIPEKIYVSSVSGQISERYVQRVGKADKFFVSFKKEDGDVEVFENTDSLWWNKWNSADLQQQLVVGKNVTVTVTGWRIPPLSLFRNIVYIEK